jgi:hypothetical protein
MFTSFFKSIIFVLFIIFINNYIELNYKCKYYDENHIIYSFICLIVSFFMCVAIHMIFNFNSICKYMICMIIPVSCLITSLLYVNYQMDLYYICKFHYDEYNIYYHIIIGLMTSYIIYIIW